MISLFFHYCWCRRKYFKYHFLQNHCTNFKKTKRKCSVNLRNFKTQQLKVHHAFIFYFKHQFLKYMHITNVKTINWFISPIKQAFSLSSSEFNPIINGYNQITCYIKTGLVPLIGIILECCNPCTSCSQHFKHI